MKRTHVLLLFGGESPEHEVSINSAANVQAAIDQIKYNVTLCYVDPRGVWLLVDSVRKAINGDSCLKAELGKNVFYAGEKKLKPDVILPILHGSGGEDGSVQGLAQLMHIPIAGPSLTSSVLAMDKDITKKLLTASDLPVVDWIVIHKTSPYPDYKAVKQQLGTELFVKPASTGSSVGVSKASSSQQFKAAVKEAFRNDTKIIIESAARKTREIEVAVIGNQQPEATSPGEIVLGDTFYSYDAKYSQSSSAKVEVPAKLDVAVVQSIKKMALQAYRAIEGRGMARIDFFLQADGKIYINEINTIPGFTNISMYPKLWQHEGLQYSELIDRLLQFAVKK